MLIYYIWSEKAMAPHSSTLARKVPWMEEPGRLQSMGSLRVGTTERLFTFMHWSRQWHPTPVFLPGESQRSLVGYSPWSAKVRHVWATNTFTFTQASIVLEPRTSRCSSWILKRQRNQRSNCQHPSDHRKTKRDPEKHLLLLYWLC